MEIRFANEQDYSWLAQHDEHVDKAWVQRCLALNEYIVAEEEGQLIGFLRYSQLWGKIPYMDMIWIDPSRRHQGIGRAFFSFWESSMAMNKAAILMTSSMSDEIEPQEWHKSNGFRESGRLTFGTLQEIPEIFFVKDLSK